MSPNQPDHPVIVSTRHFAASASPGWDNSYRMIRLLGRGTMASVYLAEQVSMARPVALKILSPALAADKQFVERFLREARASARLNHPNIVSAIEFGEMDSRFYLAMEFVDGETLSAMLEREGALDEKRVLGIGLQILSALRHAAENHVIHLDVKPANIMIRKDGRVKLADFGLAMLVDSPGMAEASRKGAGTPYYMAPEQVEGGKLDWRVDQYALGASLYEAVTGRKPFQGASISDILVKRFFENPDPAWRVGKRASRNFSAILAKMMSRSPEGRYQSFADMETDFNLAKDGKKPAVARSSYNTTSAYSRADARRNALDHATAIERVDSTNWLRRRTWFLHVLAAFVVALAVYALANVRALTGPRLPETVRGELAAEAADPPPDRHNEARRNWETATDMLMQAERVGSAALYARALREFRILLGNRRQQDSVYYPAAKQNADYIEDWLETWRRETEARAEP